MVELHRRVGRPRKDGRALKTAFVHYREPVPPSGPLSGEDALRLLDGLEDSRGRAEAVERICRLVGLSGAGPR